MIRALTISLVLFGAACGGKKTEPATTTTTAASHPGGVTDPDKEMANMPPEIAKFHDVLAPRWHADKGPQRMKDTCAAMADFTTGVTAIAQAETPTGADTEVWTSSAGELAAAVSKLDDTCKANDAAAFEVAFQKVHETFHGVMAAASGHAEAGGAGEGGEGEHDHAM
jgi:hypothetical protein